VGLVVGEGEVEGVGEADGEDVGLEVGMRVADGDADGEVVVDGEVEGELEGLAGADVVPRAGPTRFGVWAGWPVNSSAMAAMAMPSTATAPPVATPAANERGPGGTRCAAAHAAWQAAWPGGRPSC
jgi:hypothetical protein